MTGGHVFSVFLDGAVIVLLVAVIFYAGRLSLYLRDFRAGRKDMDRLIRELSAGIGRADQAMAGLREAARDSGRDLQALINEASALSEELQMISEAGNNMARRLETVAEKSGRAVSSPSAPAIPSVTADRARGGGPFAIRDPDFEFSSDMEDEDDLQDFEEENAGGLRSRAEQELFEALQGTSRKKAKV